MKNALQIQISGIVQGVGFRPFVWRLAQQLQVCGIVRNNNFGVEIIAEASIQTLTNFKEQISISAPSLSIIEKMDSKWIDNKGFSEFTIESTVIYNSSNKKVTQANQTNIGADIATCADCASEILNPLDKRYRYGLTTCTNCGPRYSVTHSLPYDRAQTSLNVFPLCPICQAEYQNPAERRFHAETTCCPDCGPKLKLVNASSQEIIGDAISQTLQLILAGNIVAIKGLGGFHLVCDGTNLNAVAQLRERKNRDEKPFALMFANLVNIKKYAYLNQAEESLLLSPTAPIILVRKNINNKLANIAPSIAWLGVMLPYTPIQHLLFYEYDKLKKDNDLILVMTSANPGGEPLVIDNNEAIFRLQKQMKIADAVLMHNREILIRNDDSVVRVNTNKSQFIRRARGFTPQAIILSDKYINAPSVLAVGGFYKNTICLTRGNRAFVSQHIGSLDNPATCEFLQETVNHLMQILEIKPKLVVHDLHPDYYSTNFAHDFAKKHNLPLLGIQHHKAHIGAVLAEHKIAGNYAVLGLTMDGVGLGDSDYIKSSSLKNSNVWGGELFLFSKECESIDRIGALKTQIMPGGESSARSPWKMAAGVLKTLNRKNINTELKKLFAEQKGVDILIQMLEKNINCPMTSSAGRLFDSVCGLLNICPNMSFEGQAPMMLEGLAQEYLNENPNLSFYKNGWQINNNILSFKPFLEHLVNERLLQNNKTDFFAAQFHLTLIEGLFEWLTINAKRENIKTIALSGGCFLNHILATRLTDKLQSESFTVLTANLVPPNDGGLALGQAYLAINANS